MSNTTNIPNPAELKDAIFLLLGKVDCETITRKELTRDLESIHGWDLSTLKENVKNSLNAYFVQEVQHDAEQEEQEEEEEEKHFSVTNKGGGFSKPCQLSSQLSEFLSCDILSRTEVVKRMWTYIKEKDLQNPKDRREIICDTALEKVLKRKKVTMFQLNKVLSPMMKSISDLQDGGAAAKEKKRAAKVSSSVGSSSSSKPKKVKVKVEAKKEKKDKSTPAKKSKKDANKPVGSEEKPPRAPNPNAFGGPVTLVAPLAKFLGKTEAMPRTEVTKLMWNYIKENDLQNPDNRKEILCDPKLKSLFKVDAFTMFQMATLLKPMLIKMEK